MAGTTTLTELTWTGLKKITFDWLSDGSGDADQVSAETYTGVVKRAVFISDSGGTAPTDLWDVVVEDADGTDVLHGNGANITAAATVLKAESDGLGAVVLSTLNVVVSNAGISKGGKVILYIKG